MGILRPFKSRRRLAIVAAGLGATAAAVTIGLVVWDRLDSIPPSHGVTGQEAVARLQATMDQNMPRPRIEVAARADRFCHVFPESCLLNHDWVWVVEATADPPDGQRHTFAADYATATPVGVSVEATVSSTR